MIPFTQGTDYPSSHTLVDVKLIGVSTVNAFAYTFALLRLRPASGQDVVQLSTLVCNQGVWATQWANLGTPVSGISFEGTFQGNVVTAGNNIWVYVCGNDGQLWCKMWVGAWMDWKACPAVAGGPSRVEKVDHAVAALVYVVDSAGQAWAMAANAFGQWVATKQEANTIAGLDRQVLPLMLGGGYYCALVVTLNGLDPKLYKNAGIASNDSVFIKYDATLPIGRTLNKEAQVCVVGWNPSAPQVICYSAWYSLGEIGSVRISLAPTFEEGAFCWVWITEGSVRTNFTAVADDAYGKMSIRHDQSEANFNYLPKMASGPSGGNVSYAASVKGMDGTYRWSFSGCNNCA